jgi:hypothetical protein
MVVNLTGKQHADDDDGDNAAKDPDHASAFQKFASGSALWVPGGYHSSRFAFTIVPIPNPT